ncbi:isochorismate synthase [Patiriisocius hiemis]|uniref:isochorismate synthase n=1 Tax=Patiriisocius hiemis TaxID=3075604 RepID=A0ABU2YHQ1_9FLAO|nr:isochorismate synthase [Constantimarinum sp. W242]MDT0556603.1 isochorismate synthase [Constantimarinum sp. W242]
MEYSNLTSKIEAAYAAKRPFVFFSKPNEDSATAIFPTLEVLHPVTVNSHDGFLFAPFLLKDKVYLYPLEGSEVYTTTVPNINTLKTTVKIQESKKTLSDYEGLISKTISEIKKTNLKKVVISRNVSIDLKNFKIDNLLTRLFNLYPDAYRYIWYHPNHGLWCGATPELLLKTDGSVINTIALAATQTNGASISWTVKEKEEQSLVTRDISSLLQSITTALNIGKAKTHVAGTLAHLKTDITGVLNKGVHDVSSLASRLHPTPAICGTPTEMAKDFILKNEGYDRSFYTGFFGITSNKGRVGEVYVNLRCMKIENKKATLYTGGGITASSKPKDERIETQKKQQTMLQVLAPFL